MNLIFDFDGTLIDSFDCVVAQFNCLAQDYKFRKIDLEQIDELRHLNSKELIALFHIPFYKMPIVLYKARKALHENINSIAPFDNIPQIVEALFNQGFSLGIVSSNSEENVRSWLKHQNMQKYFDFIHGGSSYFGKKRVLKKVLKMKKIQQAFYIGDETRDIDAANQSNIYSMAVTWGFNSEKILTQYNPHCIARTPEDILTLSLEYKDKLSVHTVPREYPKKLIISS